MLAAATAEVAAGRGLVAVSGGPDSTALLLALHELGRPVVAAHFDHALRPGSEADAEWVARLCRRLGVPLAMERRLLPLPRGSRQAAARELRYEFLERARQAAGADWIATAHTADDVVEGQLLHLLRGSGLAGLRGMPARRGRITRPLIGVRRTELDAFLQERGISARLDPSNADLRNARVRVRSELLPALEADLPGLTDRLLRLAGRAAGWQAGLEAAAEALLAHGSRRATLAAATAAVRAEAFRQLYARAGGRMPGLGARHLAAMAAVAAGVEPRAVSLPGSFVFVSAYGLVSVRDAGEPPQPQWRLTCRARPAAGSAPAGRVQLRPGRIDLGPWRPGLRMRPLGGRGTRKLQDILVDAKIPREERLRLPLVFRDGRLAWVPGVAVDADGAALPGTPCIEVSVGLDFFSQEGG